MSYPVLPPLKTTFLIRATILLLFFVLAGEVVSQGNNDSFVFDDTLLLLRNKELDIQTRLERIKIDQEVVEQRWQKARSRHSASQMDLDSGFLTDTKSAAYWEHLKALRIEQENYTTLKKYFHRYSTIRKSYLAIGNTRNGKSKSWALLADSSEHYLEKVTTDSQWVSERQKENTLELKALSIHLSAMKDSLSANDRRWLSYRQSYIKKQIDNDSSFLSKCSTELLPAFTYYYGIARDSLKNRTLVQRIQEAIEQVQAIWHFELSNIEGSSITIGKIIMALLVIVLGIKIAQVISKRIAAIIVTKMSIDVGIVDAGQKLFFYFFSVLFAVYALYIVRVPLTVFTLAGGALALGLGFGSQNILNNFISGLILLVERPVKTGDFIEVESSTGSVETIGLRSVRIRTDSNEHLVIPNSYILEKPLINWTLSDKTIRLELEVGVAYGSPVREVKRLLLAAAAANERLLKKPEPLVLFSDFGDNSLKFHLLFWVRLIKIVDKRMVLSQLRFKITDLFNTAGITIAFPQRDVHLDTLSPLKIAIEKGDQG